MILKPVLGWLHDLEASPCRASWSWSLSLAGFVILKPVLVLLHDLEACPWLASWGWSSSLTCLMIFKLVFGLLQSWSSSLASWSWSFCFSGFVFLKLMCMPLKSWSLFATWLTNISRLLKHSSLCRSICSYSMVLKPLLGSFRDHKSSTLSVLQQIWLRTALCGGWCRHMALHMPETTTTSTTAAALILIGCVVLFIGWFHRCIRLEHSDASLMQVWCNQPVNKTMHLYLCWFHNREVWGPVWLCAGAYF